MAQPEPGREPAALEARLYEPLFRSASPGELGDAWLEDLNPDSLTIVRGALAPPRLAGARVSDRISAGEPIPDGPPFATAT